MSAQDVPSGRPAPAPISKWLSIGTAAVGLFLLLWKPKKRRRRR